MLGRHPRQERLKLNRALPCPCWSYVSQLSRGWKANRLRSWPSISTSTPSFWNHNVTQIQAHRQQQSSKTASWALRNTRATQKMASKRAYPDPIKGHGRPPELSQVLRISPAKLARAWRPGFFFPIANPWPMEKPVPTCCPSLFLQPCARIFGTRRSALKFGSFQLEHVLNEPLPCMGTPCSSDFVWALLLSPPVLPMAGWAQARPPARETAKQPHLWPGRLNSAPWACQPPRAPSCPRHRPPPHPPRLGVHLPNQAKPPPASSIIGWVCRGIKLLYVVWCLSFPPSLCLYIADSFWLSFARVIAWAAFDPAALKLCAPSP